MSEKWITHNPQAIDDTVRLPSSTWHRTTCATTYIHLNILRHLDQASGAVRMPSVDFAKAVDKLPHAVILSAIINLQLPTEACVLD